MPFGAGIEGAWGVEDNDGIGRLRAGLCGLCSRFKSYRSHSLGLAFIRSRAGHYPTAGKVFRGYRYRPMVYPGGPASGSLMGVEKGFGVADLGKLYMDPGAGKVDGG
jgi:hypothetical protein